MSACILCGSRGLADSLLNLVLFVPFGAAVVGSRRLVWALAAGFLFSVSIEMVQTLIPGREPTVGDLVFNSLGALAGASLARHSSAWVHPSVAHRPMLATGAAFLAAALILVGGPLRRPSLPDGTYFGQWTRKLGDLAQYEGRLLDARVGARSLPDDRLENSGDVAAGLLSDQPLGLTAIAGPPPDGLALIFSIHDDRQREVVSVGVDQEDLMGSYGSVAGRLKLASSAFRIPKALSGIQPGDTFGVEFLPAEGTLTFRAEGIVMSHREHRGPGDGWRLLLDPDGLGDGTLLLAGAIWLMLLAIPFGYWAGGSIPGLIAGTGLLYFATLGAPAVGLDAASPSQLPAVAVGVLIGALLSKLAGSGRV